MTNNNLVIIKNYMCWADSWFDSLPMTLEDALVEYSKMVRNFRRGLSSREPIIVDLHGNEITVG